MAFILVNSNCWTVHHNQLTVIIYTNVLSTLDTSRGMMMSWNHTEYHYNIPLYMLLYFLASEDLFKKQEIWAFVNLSYVLQLSQVID
jgi:hypothetical protein